MKKTNGVAILSALCVLSLIVIAVTAMQYRLQLSINNISLTKFSDQAILESPREFKIIDAQQFFNLNNLETKAWHPIFVQLLKSINPNINNTQAKLIIYQIISQNLPLYHHSQARLAKSLSQEDYLKLEPMIIALPEKTKINLNTAAPPLLKLVLPNINLALLDFIIERRRDQPIESIDSLSKEANIKIPADFVTTKSEYIILASLAKQADIEIPVYSHIYNQTLWHQSLGGR